MNNKYLLKFTTICACVIFLTSCGGSGSKKSDIENVGVSDVIRNIRLADSDTILPEWSKENIVVNHWPADPDNLHPTNGGTATRTWIMQYTANFILRSDIINLGICPDLAEALPEVSANNLEYTYTLRKDAKWDDGANITAEDIVFLFKASKCPLTNNPITKSYFENIKTVKTYENNPYKFTIIMKREHFNNVMFLTDYPVIQRKFFDPQNILSKYTFEQFDDPAFVPDAYSDLTAWANEFNDAKYGADVTKLNGSGPYEVAKWTRGQTLILERKKNHWTMKLKEPNEYEISFPEKIIFKITSDPNAQKLEFRAQTIDASVWLSTATATELMAEPDFNKNYNIQFTDNYSYNYIGLNMKPDGINRKKIFDDVKVRRAMAYVVPIDDLIQQITLSYAKRQVGPVSPLKPEFNKNLQPIPYDLAAAGALLDEAGWKDTDGDNVRDKIIDGVKNKLQIEFKYQAGPKFADDIAMIIKESAYKAGIELITLPVESNILKEHLQKHDFDMYMSAWSGGAMPEDFTQLWHTASYTSGGSNYVGFGNSATDALIDSIKYTIDDVKRIPMVNRFQQIVYTEQPYVFLYSASRKNIIHKRFGNQIMTFDRPGNVLNNLRLLTLYGPQGGTAKQQTSTEN